MNAPLRFSLPESLHAGISNEQPPIYEHAIPYGESSFLSWDTGSMYEQTVIQKGFGFCLLNFSISKYTVLTIESLLNFNTIQYTLKGNASCMLTGHGIMALAENTYTPMYIPKGIHFVGFEPDNYTFLYVILSEDHLGLLSQEHTHLKVLIQKLLTSSDEGMLLERMVINRSVNTMIKRLENISVGGIALNLELQEMAIKFIGAYNDDIVRKNSSDIEFTSEEYADWIKLYVLDNITSPEKSSLQNLTKLFHTTERTLERHFKKKFNQSLRSYIQRIRLDGALYMLLSGDKSISDIAHDLGYADVYTFSKQFTKRYEFSPRYARDYFYKTPPAIAR